MPEPEIPIEHFMIFATGLDHPECVTFDRAGPLWAGGEAGQVYRIDPAGKVHTVAALGGFTGGIAFSPLDGALYVCNPSLGLARVEAGGRHAVFGFTAPGLAGALGEDGGQVGRVEVGDDLPGLVVPAQ